MRQITWPSTITLAKSVLAHVKARTLGVAKQAHTLPNRPPSKSIESCEKVVKYLDQDCYLQGIRLRIKWSPSLFCGCVEWRFHMGTLGDAFVCASRYDFNSLAKFAGHQSLLRNWISTHWLNIVPRPTSTPTIACVWFGVIVWNGHVFSKCPTSFCKRR